MKALSEYTKSATPFGFACLLFFAFWQGAPLPVSAQENSGMTLRGRVSGQDENGVSLGVIPKATVEFANADGSSAGQVEANDTGYYEIKGILPGAYTYRVSAAGYHPDDVGRGVVIPVGADGPVFDFILTQGELNPPKPGILSGFAWEEKDGKRSPMQGVQISARMEAGNRFVTDYTDAEGAYTFTLPVGDWKASALALGMEPQVNPDVVTVKPDAAATVDFIFSPAKQEVPPITNKVYALASVPAGVAGAAPEVNFLNRETGGTSPGKVSLVTAEQLGGLGLPGDALSGTLTWYQAEPTSPLAPGTYFAEGIREGFPAAQSPEKPISLDGTTWFDIAFVPEGSGGDDDDGDMTDTEIAVTPTEPLISGVRGRVSGQNEEGENLGIVAGATVELLDGAGNVGGKATTNETGYYEMIGLASGKWVYRVTAPDYAADDAGRGFILEEGSGIQVFDYILSQKLVEPSLTGVVRGSVWKGGGQERLPLPGTMISLRPEEGGAIQTTMTDDDGAYRMDLPAKNWQASALTGDFKVSVYPSTLTIAAGGEVQADFTFPADGKPPVIPVENVYILTSVEKGPDGKTQKPVINLVSDDGQASIPAIVEPITDDALAKMGIAGSSADKSWDWYGAKPSAPLPVGNYSARGQSEGCLAASTETKAVGESISVTFDLTLSRERTSDEIPPVPPLMTGVRGQVSGKNETGAPLGVVSGATVEMLDGTGKVAARTTTNERGLYELAGLPAGNWIYRVTAPAFEPEDAGRGFSLVEGSGVKELDFTLLQKLAGEPVPGYIYGTVWLGEGQARTPLAGTTISLRPAGGGSLRTVTTDANGAYRLEVAPANWQVSALTSDFKASNFPSVVSVAAGGEAAADFIFPAGDTPPIVPLGGVYVLASVETGEDGGTQSPRINFVSGDGQSIPATVAALSSDQQAAMGIGSDGGRKPWDWYVAKPSHPLPAGSYRAAGQADDYVPASTDPKEVRDSMSVSFLLDLRRVRPPSPISVTVTSTENNPLEGAVVRMVKKPGDVSLSESPGASTDANGTVSGNLEEGFGEYDLLVSLQGYQPQRGTVTFDAANLSHMIRLEEMPEFSITATDSAGTPLPQVIVRLIGKAEAAGLEEAGFVTTNDEGMFVQTLEEGMYGEYVYLASLEGYQTQRGAFTIDAANHSLTIRLEAPAVISITVTGTENNPLEGASVKLVKKPGDVSLSESPVVLTDANGLISGPLPEGFGEYDLLVSFQGYKPQRGAVTFAQAALSHTIRLEEMPEFSITAVNSAGELLPGVAVRLTTKANEENLELGGVVETNAEGMFAQPLDESIYGQYVYLASLDGYEPKRGDFVIDEANHTLTITLEAPSPISITVTCTENNPLEGASVKLVKKPGDVTLSEAPVAMTDANGVISGILPEGLGEYDLLVSLQGYKPQRGMVTFDKANLSHTIRLEEMPEFSITVTDSAGTPLPQVILRLIGKADEASLEQIAGLQMDEEGAFATSVEENQYGEYVYLASMEGYQTQRGGFTLDATHLSHVIKLEAPIAVSITVTGNENTPLEGVNVKLVKKTGDVPLSESTGLMRADDGSAGLQTDANGAVSVLLTEGLGEYDLMASLQGYKPNRETVTFDASNLSRNIRMEKTPEFSITAVNSDGELLPGVVVKMVAKANEAGLDEAGSVTTNETGEYSQALDESQFGQYVFLANLEGYEPKRGEFLVDQANHSFTITLEAPAAISITVTCTENNPLEGAVVKLVKKPGDVTLAETSGAKTSVNGVISGVLPEGFGEYDIMVSLEGYKPVRGPFTFDEANLAFTVKLEEEADWIRMILTEGWGDIQRSLQFHQNGVNADPEDSNVDYALGLSALTAGDAEQAPGAFVQAVGKVNETGWWDRACEGYIWTLMSLNQENVAAREINRLVSAQYGTREGNGAATQTAYLFGVAVGVMNGPWKNEGTAAAHAQLDQSVAAALKEPLLTAYLQGRGSVVSEVPEENPENDRMKDGLQTEVNRLNLRIQTIVDTEHPQVVAAIAAAENAPPGERMQPNNNAGMKENLDARWANLEMMLGNQIAGYDGQINGISEQIIGIDGQLADLANNPPVCQECRNNGETVGNPAECPECAQALERERIKLNLARNQLVAQITNIEPMKAAVVKQLEDAWNVYQNQLAQLNQPGEPQPNPAMNTNLAALNQRKTDLETEYNTIQTQLADLTNRINGMGRPDPNSSPGEARKPFNSYIGYPIEERRQELLNSLTGQTPVITR